MQIRIDDKNLHMEGPIDELGEGISKAMAAMAIAAYEQNPENPKEATLEITEEQEEVLEQLVSMAKKEYKLLMKSKRKTEGSTMMPLPKPEPTTLKQLMAGHQATQLERIIQEKKAKKEEKKAGKLLKVEKPKKEKKSKKSKKDD